MGGKGSGRKAISYFAGSTAETLERAAPLAARYLLKVVTASKAKDKAAISMPRIDAAKFIINQAIGSPSQKLQVSGNLGQQVITYQQIIIDTEKLLKSRENNALLLPDSCVDTQELIRSDTGVDQELIPQDTGVSPEIVLSDAGVSPTRY